MRAFLPLMIFVSFLFGCIEQPPIPTSPTGVWEAIGSGWILHVEDTTHYSLYDVTEVSCLPQRQADWREIAPAITLRNDTLSWQKGVITYRFRRISVLPELCGEELTTEKQRDPLFNFMVFATTVRDHYAFLDLNNIDWSTLYAKYRRQLEEEPTDVRLYQVLEAMLEELKDNHGYLDADEALYAALPPEEPETEPTQKEYGDLEIAALVSKHHLERKMTKDSWLIDWGTLNDSIGYVQLKTMWLFAELDVPSELTEEMGYVDAYVTTFSKMYEGDYIEREVAGVRKVMDRVMADLEEMDAIVLDVRFNGGGQDAVSFEILRRFSSVRQPIARERIRYGDKMTSPQTLYLEAASDAFKKPCYVLTSPQTGSAAEALSIATLALDNCWRIGASTYGALSTALEKKLPNGWSFALSNEVYLDLAGNLYENRGVPPDLELAYPRERQPFFRSVAADLAGDKRAILRAIAELSSGKTQ